MKKHIVTAIAASLLIASTGLSLAQATDTPVAGHPRVNEVDQRLDNQQNRINAGVADGQLNAKQVTRDETRDAKTAQQLSNDEAKNGGHITKAEQKHLNKKLNKNSKKIHKQRTAATATPATTTAQ